MLMIHRINKFYHIFSEVLFQVLYDISEALEGYNYDKSDKMFVWLTKLYNKVATLYGKQTYGKEVA